MNPHTLSFHALPGVCMLCMANTHHHFDLCCACRVDLPWISHACRYCAITIHPDRTLCQQCTDSPPVYSAALCGFEYRFPIDHLVRGFKDQNNLAAGFALTHLVAHHIIEQLPTLSGNELIVPVPMHPRTLRSRGFNQSRLIAQWASEILGLKIDDIIHKTKPSKPQKSLSIKERWNNLQGVFALPQRLDRQRIILVDDVITTGATAEILSRLLIEAGADDVIVIALARTPSAPSSTV